MQFWVIILFAVVLLRNSLGSAVGTGAFGLSGWEAAALALGPLAALSLGTHLVLLGAWRLLDRTGSMRALALADRMVTVGRIGVVALHAFNILVLGWLDLVRGAIGDLVLVDEALGVAPALLAIASMWWSFYPIDRALREAAQMRRFDTGQPVYPVPSRGSYLWSNVRHGVLLTAVPMTLVVGWIETFEYALRRAGDWGGTHPSSWRPVAALARWAHEPGVHEWVTTGGQLVGIAAVFLLGPLAMKMVWDTAPLGAGPMRERLESMCGRARVGVRELLVWRTHGSMVNGAVMGLVAPVRYVLLTDALLDSLPERQVEAVMAHELAHVRRRHIPWLAGVMFAGFSAVALLADWAARIVPWPTAGAAASAADVALGVGSLAVVLVGFGYASRRFEWQADAFAAQHLTGDSPTVTTEAVEAMAGALESVARLNHIPRRKFTWRHGSIAQRQQKLRALVGLPVDDLPIDREVRRIKLAAVVVLALSVGVGIVQGLG